LHRCFPDIIFHIEDLSFEGDFVYCRWRARGTHARPLWEQRPENFVPQEVLLSGCFISLFAYGNQRIIEQWHFYSMPSLVQLVFPSTQRQPA